MRGNTKTEFLEWGADVGTPFLFAPYGLESEEDVFSAAPIPSGSVHATTSSSSGFQRPRGKPDSGSPWILDPNWIDHPEPNLQSSSPHPLPRPQATPSSHLTSSIDPIWINPNRKAPCDRCSALPPRTRVTRLHP